MWKVAAAFLAGVLTLCSAVPAFAEEVDRGDEERRRFDDRPLSISAVLGFGTLVGVAGFTLGYELHDRIAIGAGLGTNLEGWMGGPYVRFRPVVAWLQLEPSWETRSVSGTTFRVGLGWSVLLTPETVGCEGPITGKPCGEPIPLVGVVSFSLGVPIAG